MDRGLIRVKKIKIRFPEKYSDLRGASLKILSIKHTFLEITKASLFLKYNVIYSTFTTIRLFLQLVLFINFFCCGPNVHHKLQSEVLSLVETKA